MLELLKGSYKRSGLTETVLVIFVLTVPYSTVSIGTLQELQEKGLIYPEEFPANRVLIGLYCIHDTVISLQILRKVAVSCSL